MKNNRKNLRIALVTTLAAAGLALSGTAMAHPGGPGPDGAFGGPMAQCKAERFAKKIAQFDSNKDGMLDEDERYTMHETRRANALAKYDKDGDGKLSRQERSQLKYDKMVEIFESIDSDRNAEISRTEADNSCSPLTVHFDRVYSNGDGVVS
ncbi:MAG: hypothetical protein AAGC55_09035, partial [Myxococcota bacterium]